jgi:hypothetical protein
LDAKDCVQTQTSLLTEVPAHPLPCDVQVHLWQKFTLLQKSFTGGDLCFVEALQQVLVESNGGVVLLTHLPSCTTNNYNVRFMHLYTTREVLQFQVWLTLGIIITKITNEHMLANAN